MSSAHSTAIFTPIRINTPRGQLPGTSRISQFVVPSVVSTAGPDARQSPPRSGVDAPAINNVSSDFPKQPSNSGRPSTSPEPFVQKMTMNSFRISGTHIKDVARALPTPPPAVPKQKPKKNPTVAKGAGSQQRRPPSAAFSAWEGEGEGETGRDWSAYDLSGFLKMEDDSGAAANGWGKNGELSRTSSSSLSGFHRDSASSGSGVRPGVTSPTSRRPEASTGTGNLCASSRGELGCGGSLDPQMFISADVSASQVSTPLPQLRRLTGEGSGTTVVLSEAATLGMSIASAVSDYGNRSPTPRLGMTREGNRLRELAVAEEEDAMMMGLTTQRSFESHLSSPMTPGSPTSRSRATAIKSAEKGSANGGTRDLVGRNLLDDDDDDDDDDDREGEGSDFLDLMTADDAAFEINFNRSQKPRTDASKGPPCSRDNLGSDEVGVSRVASPEGYRDGDEQILRESYDGNLSGGGMSAESGAAPALRAAEGSSIEQQWRQGVWSSESGSGSISISPTQSNQAAGFFGYDLGCVGLQLRPGTSHSQCDRPVSPSTFNDFGAPQASQPLHPNSAAWASGAAQNGGVKFRSQPVPPKGAAPQLFPQQAMSRGASPPSEGGGAGATLSLLDGVGYPLPPRPASVDVGSHSFLHHSEAGSEVPFVCMTHMAPQRCSFSGEHRDFPISQSIASGAASLPLSMSAFHPGAAGVLSSGQVLTPGGGWATNPNIRGNGNIQIHSAEGLASSAPGAASGTLRSGLGHTTESTSLPPPQRPPPHGMGGYTQALLGGGYMGLPSPTNHHPSQGFMQIAAPVNNTNGANPSTSTGGGGGGLRGLSAGHVSRTMASGLVIRSTPMGAAGGGGGDAVVMSGGNGQGVITLGFGAWSSIKRTGGGAGGGRQLPSRGGARIDPGLNSRGGSAWSNSASSGGSVNAYALPSACLSASNGGSGSGARPGCPGGGLAARPVSQPATRILHCGFIRPNGGGSAQSQAPLCDTPVMGGHKGGTGGSGGGHSVFFSPGAVGTWCASGSNSGRFLNPLCRQQQPTSSPSRPVVVPGHAMVAGSGFGFSGTGVGLLSLDPATTVSAGSAVVVCPPPSAANLEGGGADAVEDGGEEGGSGSSPAEKPNEIQDPLESIQEGRGISGISKTGKQKAKEASELNSKKEEEEGAPPARATSVDGGGGGRGRHFVHDGVVSGVSPPSPSPDVRPRTHMVNPSTDEDAPAVVSSSAASFPAVCQGVTSSQGATSSLAPRKHGPPAPEQHPQQQMMLTMELRQMQALSTQPVALPSAAQPQRFISFSTAAVTSASASPSPGGLPSHLLSPRVLHIASMPTDARPGASDGVNPGSARAGGAGTFFSHSHSLPPHVASLHVAQNPRDGAGNAAYLHVAGDPYGGQQLAIYPTLHHIGNGLSARDVAGVAASGSGSGFGLGHPSTVSIHGADAWGPGPHDNRGHNNIGVSTNHYDIAALSGTPGAVAPKSGSTGLSGAWALSKPHTGSAADSVSVPQLPGFRPTLTPTSIRRPKYTAAAALAAVATQYDVGTGSSGGRGRGGAALAAASAYHVGGMVGSSLLGAFTSTPHGMSTGSGLAPPMLPAEDEADNVFSSVARALGHEVGPDGAQQQRWASFGTPPMPGLFVNESPQAFSGSNGFSGPSVGAPNSWWTGMGTPSSDADFSGAMTTTGTKILSYSTTFAGQGCPGLAAKAPVGGLAPLVLLSDGGGGSFTATTPYGLSSSSLGRPEGPSGFRFSSAGSGSGSRSPAARPEPVSSPHRVLAIAPALPNNSVNHAVSSGLSRMAQPSSGRKGLDGKKKR